MIEKHCGINNSNRNATVQTEIFNVDIAAAAAAVAVAAAAAATRTATEIDRWPEFKTPIVFINSVTSEWFRWQLTEMD